MYISVPVYSIQFKLYDNTYFTAWSDITLMGPITLWEEKQSFFNFLFRHTHRERERERERERDRDRDRDRDRETERE